MVKIQPFGDRVLVRVLEPKEELVGGLLMAATTNSKNRGIVEAVGEGITLADGTIKPLTVKEGDKVLFTVGSGINYNTDKSEYKILSIREIVGKIVGEED